MPVVEVVSARLSLGPGRARWGTTRLPCQADWGPPPLRQLDPACTSRPTEVSAEGAPGGPGTPRPTPARRPASPDLLRTSQPSSYLLQRAAGPLASSATGTQLHRLSAPAAGGRTGWHPQELQGARPGGPTGSGGPPGLQGLQAHGERPRLTGSGAWLDLGLDSGPWKLYESIRETRDPACPRPESGSGPLRRGLPPVVPPQALQDRTPPRAPQHVHPPPTPQGSDGRAAGLVLINRHFSGT